MRKERGRRKEKKEQGHGFDCVLSVALTSDFCFLLFHFSFSLFFPLLTSFLSPLSLSSGLTYDELNEALERYGLFFPMDPGPGASIGGMYVLVQLVCFVSFRLIFRFILSDTSFTVGAVVVLFLLLLLLLFLLFVLVVVVVGIVVLSCLDRVGTSCSGTNAVRYGTMKDNVLK